MKFPRRRGHPRKTAPVALDSSRESHGRENGGRTRTSLQREHQEFVAACARHMQGAPAVPSRPALRLSTLLHCSPRGDPKRGIQSRDHLKVDRYLRACFSGSRWLQPASNRRFTSSSWDQPPDNLVHAGAAAYENEGAKAAQLLNEALLSGAL